ncbi:MAG: hypothetical protein Q9182_005034 [Xanthomendoza sp. 2 TL-2023]
MNTPPNPVSPASFNIYFRLDRLIDEYGSMTTIHPAITQFRMSPGNDGLLQQALSNDYKLLLGRSPDLEDHEINVFEAAFLTLMKRSVTHPGALAIYVEEILGLKVCSETQKFEVLKNAIHVRTLFLNLVVNGNCIRSPTDNHNPRPSNLISSAQQASIGLQIFNSIKHPSAPSNVEIDSRPPKIHRMHGLDRSIDTAAVGTMDDPKLTELLALYRETRDHFEETDQDTKLYLALAKVLRDKAKECMQYMAKINVGDMRLAELRDTYERMSIMECQEGQRVKRRRGCGSVDAP